MNQNKYLSDLGKGLCSESSKTVHNGQIKRQDVVMLNYRAKKWTKRRARRNSVWDMVRMVSCLKIWKSI